MTPTKKAKAPFLALAFNLVFDPHIANEFKKKPRKVLEAFGIDDSDKDRLMAEDAQEFLVDKVTQDIDAHTKPEVIIPHHELYWSIPTLSLTYTLLTNGTVSDRYQPDDEEYREKLFSVFGVEGENLKKAFEMVRPDTGVIIESVLHEFNNIVEKDFSFRENIT